MTAKTELSAPKRRTRAEVVAKRAIREALGQILEYAYFRSDSQSPTQTVDAELFIVAPGSADEKASAYLNLLRDKFHIPVQYCQFESSGVLPDAFKTPKGLEVTRRNARTSLEGELFRLWLSSD